MRRGHRRDRRVIQQRAHAQRAVGPGDNRIPVVDGAHVGLVQQRVQFDLIDDRRDETQIDQVGQLLGAEVADADRPGVTDLLGLHEPAPGVDVLAVQFHRPGEQAQIDVIHAEARDAGFARVLRALETLVGLRQLGGDEQLITGDARIGDGPADRFFVAACRGGVDQAVAGRQPGGHRGLGLGRRQLGDANAQHRDAVVVAERKGGNPRRRRHVTCLCSEAFRWTARHRPRLTIVRSCRNDSASAP